MPQLLQPAAVDADYAAFQRRVLAITGVDLTCYKPEQMRRRLGSLMAKHGVTSFVQYAALLAKDGARLKEFQDFFTINVSEFFRDKTKWEELRALLQKKLRARPVLKVWSAGCSIGAEPYSVAMLLAELTPGARHTIVATDIDRKTLERAARGDGYSANELRNVPPALLGKFFRRGADDLYTASDDLRRRVTFKPHNLLAGAYERDCDLILCRNVVIYFTDEAKAGIYRRFAEALHPQGVLFVGATEVIMQARDLGLQSIATSFYTRIGAVL
jgi:chemotaxis protein methyltransferase CheR